jgi:hypothetical protein
MTWELELIAFLIKNITDLQWLIILYGMLSTYVFKNTEIHKSARQGQVNRDRMRI